jgi:hypothetical protein
MEGTNGVQDSIPRDELLLADLASAKLAKLLQGFLSVGLTALQLDDPLGFLAPRDKGMLGFVEVLRVVVVKAGHLEVGARLRDLAAQLSDAVVAFHRHFCAVASWRKLTHPEVRSLVDQLRESYRRCCETIRDYRTILGADSDCSRQVSLAEAMLEEFVTHLPASAVEIG